MLDVNYYWDKFMIKELKELSRETVCGKYGRSLEKVIFEMLDGTKRDFYIKKEGSSVCALALTEDNQVILAKQFRPGPKKILLELPGGGKEDGEAPEDAIARELLEETGYVGDIQFVTQVYSCGYSTMRRYAFVATNCKLIGEQNLDEYEDVDVELMALDEFRKQLRTGNMTDTETAYLGLDYLGLLK